MSKSGIIVERDKNNESYHDVIALLQLYRSVNWRMQVKINQVRHRFNSEYGTDVDSFLDDLYQAGMDINMDLDDMEERIEAINKSNKFLKLIDEAIELMRQYHPDGERYYWVLYYSFLSAAKPTNIEEILDKLEAHYPRIHRATYFRWRDRAADVVKTILWGYETENRKLLNYFRDTVEIKEAN